MNLKMTPIALLVAGLATPVMAADEAPKASTNVGEINVQGQAFGGGQMIQEETPKARATITKKAIENKTSTQNPYQLIDKLPGVNAMSTDATGLSGGTLRIRGFDATQMGFTVDGAPVNDSGSYEVYPQEYVDAENLEEVYVTQGTTDNDAPHVGATGGNVGIVTSGPKDRFGFRFDQTFGGNNLLRTFMRVDTGKTGPFKTFVSYSHSQADKWRGAGDLVRDHVAAKTVARFGAHTFSAGIDWNEAENYFFNSMRKSEYLTGGRYQDYDTTWAGRRAVSGCGDNEGTTNPPTSTAGACAPYQGVTRLQDLRNYYQLRQNPFKNYIATFKANFHLADNLSLDVDPYYWYGLGGGSTGVTLRETAANAITGQPRLDFNGDGDVLDSVLFYRISKTETKRPGVTTRLNWTIGDHRIRVGFFYERADHRQTQPYFAVDANGGGFDVWGDKNPLVVAGEVLQGRNWKTVTTVKQLFIEDKFSVGDNWRFEAGVRAPRTTREGTNLGSGLIGSKTASDAPSQNNVSWNKVLPNVSAKYQFDDSSSAFVALSKNFRVPQNFILYERSFETGQPRNDLQPEESVNIDLGYRYTGELFNFSGSLFNVAFKNRQARAQDPDGTLRNYNVGDVNVRGLELEASTRPVNGVSGYGSVTYTRSKVLDDFRSGFRVSNVNYNVFVPTTGKDMVDTPRLMLAAGLNYQVGNFTMDFSGKYTGKRYGDLMNQESIPGFTVWDLNAGYRFGKMGMLRNFAIRGSIQNLFDKDYLAEIRTTQVNALSVTLPYVDAAGVLRSRTVNGSAPLYNPGAPRFISVRMQAEF